MFVSQSFILVHDSVLVLACWWFTFLLIKFQTKIIKNQFHFAFIFEIVLACSCSSVGTISSTNIFGVIDEDETEVYLLWDIIIHLILRGEHYHKIFQTTFSPSSGSQWLPEILGQEGDLLHLCIWVSHNHNIFWRKLDNLGKLNLFLLCLLLSSQNWNHLLHILKEKNKVCLGQSLLN